MIVEYIRYLVPPERAGAFEDAYHDAGALLGADPHCLAFEIARGVEEPQHFIVRIEWDSLEGHEQGFRSSPRFSEFIAAVQPFFQQIEEMKHYEVRAIGPEQAARSERPTMNRRPENRIVAPSSACRRSGEK